MDYGEDEVRELARRAYEEGVADFGLVAERSALLVIDMQDEFVRPGWTPFWIPEATRRVPVVQRLIGTARAAGLPVVFTAFAGTHGFLDRPASGSTMPNRYRSEPSDPAWFSEGRIWHELAPLDADIVLHKPSYGAFYDTPLETILRNLDRDTIIICGTLTNYCCGTTARQGYERGFKVVVAGDASATDDPELHQAELKVLRKGFARVMDSDEIAAHLMDPARDWTRW